MFPDDSFDVVEVLLVEDDEEDFILFKEYLGDIPYPKYKVTRFQDADAALASIRSNSDAYEIYVIDHFLGQKTGPELLKEIRSASGFAPAVLISGLPDSEIASLAEEAGFQGYLDKKTLSTFTLAKVFFALLQNRKQETFKKENGVADPLLLRMETIARFAGGIAHDFNNILNIIIANLDLLEMQCREQPNVLSRINSAQGAVMRGAEVNKKLLNFSRKQSLNPESVEPDRWIAEYLEKPVEPFPENVRVVFEPGGQGAKCKIDRSEFANCLMHLLQNAKEAVEESGGIVLIETDTVAVTSSKESKEFGLEIGNYFLLRIADNGRGADANFADKIFEPFITTKPKGKSSGLGLSMVFGFVKRSGGKIAFESHPGFGFDFYAYFPLEERQPNAHFPGKVAFGEGAEIFYFTGEGETSKRTSYVFRTLGFQVRRFQELTSFQSELSKVKGKAVLFSECWGESFPQWKEICRNAEKSNSMLKTFFVSASVPENGAENSSEILWPISRKSLVNHFGRL
ncbi:hybrid sensor histidine kinase/response regulator [Leptospira sanjuanensis]|uniref:hybrid sensor histidine kinase/response regulator n=1 Tax=Leptospira sanjuanensis TaxID=2879643 RepID=UPI001EE8624D|nr:hybrid sensor histidine kinase/response regulator [Leptospira sanjuanensis]MCG6168742.1 ATP-binding protein [Leptospira sanjuanensis]